MCIRDSTATTEELPLAGECVTITAGPTYEPIDDVRFIGNHSSGLMGISLAEALARQGAEVHLVLGPTHLRPTNPHIVVHPVMTAEEMLVAAQETFGHSSIAIFAAAVADYRPEERVSGKIKQERRGDVYKRQPLWAMILVTPSGSTSLVRAMVTLTSTLVVSGHCGTMTYCATSS